MVGLPYVEYWQNLIDLNETFLNEVREKQASCNYSSYLDTYFQFPPPQEAFPVLPAPSFANNYNCDQFDNLYSAILEVNPCFNIYRENHRFPGQRDVA